MTVRPDTRPSAAPASAGTGSRGGALLLAGVLVVGGVVLLLLNLNLLDRWQPVAHYVVAAALALGGLAFFASAQAARAWQRIIPAWTLLALALMVLLGEREQPNTRLVAALLFWGLAAAFFHILLLARRENWWALIPGGFLLVLGVVIALSGVVKNLELLAAILFGGVGLVFFAVYFLLGNGAHWWALLPGSILAIFALYVVTGATGADAPGGSAWLRWWPLLVVLIGVALAWRAFAQPAAAPPEFERHHAPPMVAPHKSALAAPAATSGATSATNSAATSAKPDLADKQALGEYTQPAPGATIDVLPDRD